MTPESKALSPGPDDEIRIRRIATIQGVWKSLVSRGWFLDDRVRLSTHLLNEVVEHYVEDRQILKVRYRIKGRIRLYKIAGLMAASLMRYRPIIPVCDELQPGIEFYANEFLAIYQSLAICAQRQDQSYCLEVMDEPWFEGWRDEMVYFLHFRNYTPEALCQVFFVLSCVKFPECVDLEAD